MINNEDCVNLYISLIFYMLNKFWSFITCVYLFLNYSQTYDFLINESLGYCYVSCFQKHGRRMLRQGGDTSALCTFTLWELREHNFEHFKLLFGAVRFSLSISAKMWWGVLLVAKFILCEYRTPHHLLAITLKPRNILFETNTFFVSDFNASFFI